jgi:Peptidase family M28
LAACVRQACRELEIPLGRLPLVGAQFDHLPFADLGLDALSLVTTGPAALSVHTPQDDASKLDADGFRRAGEVALSVLEKLGRGASTNGKRGPT